VSTTESLGNLVKVKIRTRWPNEAADFTPWLALEENMSQLGDAIGLELETERAEVAVGPYYRNPSAINLPIAQGASFHPTPRSVATRVE